MNAYLSATHPTALTEGLSTPKRGGGGSAWSVLCALAWLAGSLSLAGAPAWGEPVRATHGMVASADEIASRVGVEIMQAGGNAVDASVAVGLALAVTHPTAGNLGGGGFMLIRMADGRTTAVDYRESAPGGSSAGMYLDAKGEVRPESSTVGSLAAGVPGSVAGFALALEKYGTMKWAQVIEPALRLAKEGFKVDETLAGSLAGAKVLDRFPESKRIFRRNGEFYKAGETFRQPELAATLERLREQGPREFYEGETARLIAEEMKASGGIMTMVDLKEYRAVERTPIRGTYRGLEVISMPPPSSGGIALVQMLNMLELHDLKAIGAGSAATSHLLIEVMRRAFADRAEFPGDPGFVKIPVSGLTSKAYAREIDGTIDLKAATASAKLGHGRPAAHESPQTTHYSVVDGQGNAVANTYTLNSGYGSGATVRGAGFLLNNEMDDFAARPGTPNQFGLIQGAANAIAPGKRPLSSMSPTILLRDGRLYFVVGSPGGPTIISAVLQSIVNVVDFGMDPQTAVNAGRLHQQWMPDEVWYEANSLSAETLGELKAMGHKFGKKPETLPNAVEAILVDPGQRGLVGGSDQRYTPARAVGY